MTIVIEQTGTIDVAQALSLAQERQARRLSAVHSELQELEAEGVLCPFTASELIELEQNGFLFDFATGRVMEVT